MHINSQLRRIPPSLWLGLILSYFLSSGRAAEALKDRYQIFEGGKVSAFDVAKDEVELTSPTGHRAQQFLAAQLTAEAIHQRATELKSTNGGDVRLVLYEAGKPHNEFTRRVVSRHILVRLQSGSDLTALTNGLTGVTAIKPSQAPGYCLLETSDAAEALTLAESLRSQPGVLSAETQLARLPAKRFIPNDSYFSTQWHLMNTGQNGGTPGIDANVLTVWNTYHGEGVGIGIVDDGLQWTHPDLQGNYDASTSTNINDGTPDPMPDPTTDHHGTAVGGIAAGVGNNGLGICGVAYQAKLAGIRLIAAPISDLDVANAMSYRNDALFVKNNSWGFPGLVAPGPLAENAFEQSVQTGRNGHGTIFVWASGNGLKDGEDANYDGFANSIYTIPVAAVNDQGRQADYSTPGACLVVGAPSGDDFRQGITTTDLIGQDGYNFTGANENFDLPNFDYTRLFAGTSASAPLVSGVCALIVQANPNLGWRDVQEILMRSATKVSPTDTDWIVNGGGFNFNHKFGAGMVNAGAAVNLALTWTNLPPATNILVAQNSLSVIIPDNNTNGITRTFTLPAPGLRVEHAAVTVTIGHPSRGELAVTLISPNGTASRLAQPHPDTDPNYEDWTFTTRRDWGEDSAGIWTVRITDSSPGNTGTLLSIALNVYGTLKWPVASFTASPVRGVLPLTAVFTNLSVRATSYSWDFGDGHTSTDTNPTNVYAAAGSYTVQLTAIGPGGSNVLTRSNYIVVTNPLPPAITVTAPTTGQRWSNDVFTASGTAHGVFGTNGAVYYQLNGSDWLAAQTTNGWTNWSADLTLIPGTNTFSVYAVNILGAHSPTNTVNFFYALGTPLVVGTSGLGTITPNDNGQLLEIGRSYTLTATPALGFAFTNWSGGTDTNQSLIVLTNKPAVTFLMESNLTLLATFVDVQRPTIIITGPTINQRITNNLFTATGTASDNGQVQAVQYSLNGADWQTATGTTNWSADLTLVPGTNSLRAFSVDAYNNSSLTSSVSLFSVMPALLTVQTNGRGTLTPNYDGQLLELGRNYTMTATPSLGFVFTNWSGGTDTNQPFTVLTNKPALTFMMEPNLNLLATFVDVQRPTIVISKPTFNQRITNNLFTASGTAADNGSVQAVQYSLNGSDWQPATGTTNWSVDLTLVPGTNMLRVFSVDAYNNTSLTSSVSLFSVVPTVVTVQTNGRGTITPNYNGQLLEIGRNYTMTATPGLGFILTNWSSNLGFPGGTLTNKPALTFMMESNLSLVATFVDAQRPTVVISKPTLNQRITNNLFTASGTAADNGSVQAVQYSLNGSDWQTATGTTNWSADLALAPGTNVLRAFSVDAYNNHSLTSSVSLFSVVPALITVQTNGRGILTPNYNSQLLEIGRNYTMTATPGLGFALTNWSSNLGFPAGTLTNKPALTFLMASNLSLLATFVDVQRPTLLIAKPTLNQRITNDVSTASGTAADNGSVQAVQYSLNGADWLAAVGTTNWSVDLTLVPGTNVLRAFSVDAYNNHSLTSSVSLFYVVPALITVQTNGRGTLTPNYNGQLLEIGRDYTMTALPGLGFALTNWSGGTDTNQPLVVLTNKPALTFLMASNLSLLATFVDVQRPTVLIAKPTLNQRITNDVFTASGTALDNDHVQTVQYSLNGADWLSASGTTNWSVDLNLVPGTNVLRAFSVDAYNNSSLTSSVSLFSVVPSQITVLTNGLGTIAPNYNGQFLEIGRLYSMTATPGLGCVFSNWTGGLTSRTAALSFLMQSNLVLQANFITNPFTHAAGIYNGLFYDTNGVTHQSSGYFTATPTAQGAYSGNFSLAGVTYPFLGQFYVDGTASNSIARSGTNALTLLLDWDLAGGKVMTGTLSDGTWTAELAANRATWNALTNPAPAGRYTLLLPGGADSLAQPGGDGSGALTISPAGQIVFSGRLGDGTVVIQSATLSDDGQWPFYQSLYLGKGSVLGWLSLSNQPSSDISGAVSWIKLPQVATYYPTGFVFESESTGSLYVPPAFGVRALNFDLGQLWVTNGNLLAGFTNQVRLTSNNIVQNLGTNTLSLTLSPTLGTFTGYTIDPLTHRVLTLNGALLQKQNFGGGNFLGTNQAGRVYFGP